MVQVIEHTEGRYDVHEMEFGEVYGWRLLERVTLECGCRARLILDGRTFARCSEGGVLKCGICGERFVLTQMTDHRVATR